MVYAHPLSYEQKTEERAFPKGAESERQKNEVMQQTLWTLHMGGGISSLDAPHFEELPKFLNAVYQVQCMYNYANYELGTPKSIYIQHVCTHACTLKKPKFLLGK